MLLTGTLLVPVLLTSDQTCLTNFFGDKKLWPLFMSISNIHAEIQNQPSAQVWILIGLLPVGPKRNNKILGFSTKEQEYDVLRVQHQIVSCILSDILCRDGKVRKYIPILSTWLADHMENVNIHGIKTNQCPVCIASPWELGILPKKPLAIHNYTEYESLY
ncbi:hypothetical protein BGX38DRAFT_1106016 [Terfezia claveryi]|nr:hypothetical protein BGX38DRAFT_1106016 [Terfezia claveryi]